MVEWKETSLSTAFTDILKAKTCMYVLCMQLPSWSTVYADHKRESQDELSVKKGEIVGLVEDDSFDVYWKVRM